jgi:hypothetical protein
MAQAETIPTTSRRSFLAAAAVAAAIVAPNVAVAKPTEDSQLIELGKKLSKLVQEYYAECARLRPFWDEHKRQMDAWKESHPYREDGEGFAEYKRISAEIGLDEQEKLNHPDHVMDRIDPVASAIMTIPATTWAGVLVKAQLAKFAADDFWGQSEDDLDWDKSTMRKLVDAVIDMAARTSAEVSV